MVMSNVSSLIKSSINEALNGTGWNETSSCGSVNNLKDVSEQCYFARTVADCLDDDGFVSYIQLTYCSIQSTTVSIILLAVLLMFLFFAIGTNADDFLCPLLITISKSLNLSDNIAGVTFLAFGNGAPDIFSSIVGIGDDDPNLVIGQLYGAGIFVTTIVVGGILMQNNFQIMHRPLLRDISFYLVTTTLVWVTFLSSEIHLYNSLLFIVIYLVYVTVVIVSGYIYRKQNSPKNSDGKSKFHISSMPRENLNRQTKYKLDNKTQTNRPISLYFKKDKPDNYEGVVLRRIKFRQYCQDPLYQRRFTLYNISNHVWHRDNHRLEATESELTAATATNLNVYAISVDINHNSATDQNLNINEDNLFDKPKPLTEDAKVGIVNDSRRLTLSDIGFVPPTKQFDKDHKPSNKFHFSFRGLLASIRDRLVKNDPQTRDQTADRNVEEVQSNDKSSEKQIESQKCEQLTAEVGAVTKGIHFKSDSEDRNSLERALKRFVDFMLDLSRIDWIIFDQMTLVGKVATIIKAPIYVLYTLAIPVVDRDLPMNGWQKRLNLVHIIVSPQICIIITRISFSVQSISQWQLHLILLTVSAVVAVVVALTSEKNRPPPYHILFAYFGFFISISCIYAIANEVLNILDAIRVIFNLSKFMIGLTVLAWGNSIGDFISNLTMAKNGFPRMAISACFGGPVLNMLLGIGIPYTLLLTKGKNGLASIKLEYSRMITVLYSTITISLLTTVITLVFVTKFTANKMHGYLLYSVYVGFLVAAICTEVGLL